MIIYLLKAERVLMKAFPPLFVLKKLCETIEILIALIGENDV